MASSTSASSSRSPPLRVSPSDPTYVSLHSLLSSPASSSRHLNLLPHGGLYGSVTLYLARLDTDAPSNSEPSALEDFVQTILRSPSLWRVDGLVAPAADRIHEDVTQARESVTPSLLNRLHHLHLAAARAVFSKIEALLHQRNGSTGWNTQTALKKWSELIIKAADADQPSAQQQQQHAQSARFAIVTGLLLGLGAYRQQERDKKAEKVALNVSRAFYPTQQRWISALHEMLSADDSPQDEWEREFKSAHSQEALLPTLYLTGQVARYLSDRGLASLNGESILTRFTPALLALFSPATLQISADTALIRTPQTHVLFPLLGPLSRVLSAAAENCIMQSAQADVERVVLQGVMKQFASSSHQLQKDFLSSGLATATGSPSSSDTQQLTSLWTSLKTFLFVSVQLFDAVLGGIVEVLPTPVYSLVSEDRYKQGGFTRTSNIPAHLTTILVEQVEVHVRLAFVTFSMTSPAAAEAEAEAEPSDPTRITSNEIYNRFTAYRRAFYGSLEVIKSDLGASIDLLNRLETYLDGTPLLADPASWLARAHLTIYLDASEQLIPTLPNDGVITTRILPLCRPYLLDATYPALFESSHSCLLAIFEAKKAVCKDLMPYYLDSLLRSFPDHMDERQLSHALCTILACTSDIDDAASYYVVQELEVAIKNPDRKLSFARDDADGATAQNTTTTPVSPETTLQLQLAYVDLLPYVNLVLLRSLLGTVEKWILAATADSASHGQLCTRTFKALGGMDDTARQEGVRWWLEKREAFGV